MNHKPRRSQPSVAFGSCPSCTADRVGLVRAGAHFVWRHHNRTTWGGTKTPCPSVGVTACQAPAADPTPANTCPCRR